MAVPIFILGLQRSGTTWVANMIAGSGAVAAVAAQEHRGVHESIFFSHFARAFGAFDDPDARSRFQDAFARSDYFLLTGLDQTVLDDALARAKDFAGVFAIIMDAVAAREGNTHWLEKSPHHTLLADELAERFPEAQFVCLTRSSQTLIASRLAAYGRRPSRGLVRAADIIRGALVNALYSRRLTRFAAQHCKKALLIHYDDLVKDASAGRRRLVDFLALGISPDQLVSAFAPNTSHDRKGTRKMSLIDRTLIGIGDGIGRLVPLGILAAIERRRREGRNVNWPDWVWLKSGYDPL
ncbi:sulfotransferase [Sulfitobacter sp. AS59]|uniref:sulfotransferase family protein n=1 Tax=Sulfitobacter sp. AS59 TaxID=3135784 RepID=UPI0031731F89